MESNSYEKVTVKTKGAPLKHTDITPSHEDVKRVEVRFHVFVTSVLVGGDIRGSHNGVGIYALRDVKPCQRVVTDV
jgi:hypothetical protein